MSAHPLPSIIPALQAKILTGGEAVVIGGCYISDLLSDVLANETRRVVGHGTNPP